MPRAAGASGVRMLLLYEGSWYPVRVLGRRRRHKDVYASGELQLVGGGKPRRSSSRLRLRIRPCHGRAKRAGLYGGVGGGPVSRADLARPSVEAGPKVRGA